MEKDTQTVTSAAQEATPTVENNVVESKELVTAVADSLSLADLNKAAGREFKSKDDFIKHYENLKSFVGKKVEPANTAEVEATKKELEAVDGWFKDAGLDRKTANPFEIAKLAKAMAPRVEGESSSAAPNSGKLERIQELGKRALRYNATESDKVALVKEALGIGSNTNPAELANINKLHAKL